MGPKAAYPDVQLEFRLLYFEKVPGGAYFRNASDKLENVIPFSGSIQDVKPRGKIRQTEI